MSNEVHRFDVDAALDCVDLRFTGYIPSNDSLEFFNLIRIFTGQDFEIDTPIWHYFLADLLLGNIKREQFPYSEEIRRSITVDPSAIAILASRGAAKSTVTTLFYPIYASIKGSTPVTGPLSHILILSDSQQGGSVSQARIMASAFEKSVFAQQWFESMRFTDTEIELVRRNQSDKEVPVEKRHMLIKFKGASTGGIRSGSRNPVTGDRYALVLCHKKGTIVTTDMGTHKVEDYYNVLGEREEHGLNVQVYGLPDIETVTNEHRYWAKTLTTQQVWDVDQKRLISVKTETAPTWVEAKDLTINHMIGSPITPQQILEAPKGIKKIGYTRRLSKTEYVSGFTESIEEDGFVWRRVKSVSKTPHPEIFVPIQTPDHTYTTAFGLSHNCDDIIKNEDDSYSEALMEKVKTALESDAENAMRSRNTQMVIINTPFHKNDPLYKIVEGGAYTPLVMPICKEISLSLIHI